MFRPQVVRSGGDFDNGQIQLIDMLIFETKHFQLGWGRPGTDYPERYVGSAEHNLYYVRYFKDGIITLIYGGLSNRREISLSPQNIAKKDELYVVMNRLLELIRTMSHDVEEP